MKIDRLIGILSILLQEEKTKYNLHTIYLYIV